MEQPNPTKEEILHALISVYAKDIPFIRRVNEITYAIKTGIIKIDKIISKPNRDKDVKNNC